MATDVNLYFSSPVTTGQTVPVPQYTMDVTIVWTNRLGEKKTDTRTVLFPNVLQQLPAARITELMQEVIVERARILLGVDD